MSEIRILPDEISNRIAAGEVIERPASVVKELIENAIDAGATRIMVQTRSGGRRLVQVLDDGSGMDREDALLCIEAHATSKVRAPGDIDRIQTLGFRGEALPSIAAVSRFRLQTRQRDDAVGTEVAVDGGSLRDVRDCGCTPGTNVRVQDLFYNLPARRKFLRSAATEDGHIQEIVLLHALAHPGVSVELVMDGRRVLFAGETDDSRARLVRLLGRDVAAGMLPVDYAEHGIAVRGFAARPGFTRSSRREQRVFVNGRPAAADVVYYGIRDAYHTLVMKGRYPPVVLFIDLDPERVDVNVHPAKRDVRFREGRLVGQVVAAALRRALREAAAAVSPALQPGLGVAAPLPRPPPGAKPIPEEVAVPASDPAAGPLFPPLDRHPDGAAADSPPAVASTGAADPTAEARAAKDSAPGMPGTSLSAATRPEIAALRIIGTFGNLYLVAEGSGGLVLIDQHAAHERILFERLLAAAAKGEGPRQPLLLPVTIELAPADAAFLAGRQGDFDRLGFGLEPFGGNTVLVTAVPPGFPQENLAGMLRDILDDLRTRPGGVKRIDEVRIAQAACKHAVRAEDPLADDEVRGLLRDLARTEMPYTCPHGRPVMINIPMAELEKRFGRRA
ncbi:MAG: DNA mismatch repair endonuclease MutL [Kiritimatiellaeota bacterium]|nr:DNA mismatch repair endonuclease MutL [Kiritimatiellota bacterium]